MITSLTDLSSLDMSRITSNAAVNTHTHRNTMNGWLIYVNDVYCVDETCEYNVCENERKDSYTSPLSVAILTRWISERERERQSLMK